MLSYSLAETQPKPTLCPCQNGSTLWLRPDNQLETLYPSLDNSHAKGLGEPLYVVIGNISGVYLTYMGVFTWPYVRSTQE